MNQNIVRELARQIADGVAPDAADEFDSEADAWFADPRRSGRVRPKIRDPLGFGLEDVASTVVPTVLFVAQHILAAMTEVTAEEGVRRVARRLARGKAIEPGSSEDDEESAPDVREIAAAYHNNPETVRLAVLAAGDEFGADAGLTAEIADRVLALLKL